mgnify:CR=1 FL=1
MGLDAKNPAGAAGALLNVTRLTDRTESNTKPLKINGVPVSWDTETGPRVAYLEGRELWALRELVKAGARGCTPIEAPAPRWSHYVFLLRRRGLAIETIREPHGGRYPGRHGRYVLRSVVAIGGGAG